MKKMRLLGSAVLCTLLFGLVDSVGRYFQPSGPKPGEKGKYLIHTDEGDPKLCLYCPHDAFESTEKNKRMQEPRCIDKYKNKSITEEISPYERENKKYPLCKVGDTPGCGPPPQEQKTPDYKWICSPEYTVYSSCYLTNKVTNVIGWSYYCNEKLQWVADSVDPFAVTTSPKGDSIDFKIMMIIIGAVMSLLVLLLAAVICYLCRQIRNNGRSITEASETLIDRQPAVSPFHCLKGNVTPVSRGVSESDSDSMEKSPIQEETASKDMTSKGRLPPYGEERPTVECQTITLEVATQINPESIDHIENACIFHPENTVRAEFSHSMTSNPLTCPCTAHLRRDSPSQMISNKRNNLNLEKGIEQSKDSKNQRPTPQGHIVNSLGAESGFYEDENDMRHNTKLKQRMNERVTDSPECMNCDHVRIQEPHSRGANFDRSKHQRAQCLTKSRFVIENETEQRPLNHHHEDESFELDSQQLKQFKSETNVFH